MQVVAPVHPFPPHCAQALDWAIAVLAIDRRTIVFMLDDFQLSLSGNEMSIESEQAPIYTRYILHKYFALRLRIFGPPVQYGRIQHENTLQVPMIRIGNEEDMSR